MIAANRLLRSINCDYCHKTINYPTTKQRFCNVSCRDHFHHRNKTPRTTTSWFRASNRKRGATDKPHATTKPVTVISMQGHPEPKRWPEPADYRARKDGKCPRCLSVLQPTDVKFCEWCVRDRAHFLEIQKGEPKKGLSPYAE